MKDLDDFIMNNAGQFDTEEPPEGHLSRFDDKLQELSGRRRNSRRFLIWKIAASVAFILIVSYFGIQRLNLNNNYQTTDRSPLIMSELSEAEEYYNAQLSLYYEKIESLEFNNDKDEKRKVLEELSEMDNNIRMIKQDLRQNPDDERIVYAIINFYQVKIEIMDLIISHAQKSSSSIL